MLLLKVTKVITGDQKVPKIGQSSIRAKKALAEGRSPPQELEVSPRSGLYLLVILYYNNLNYSTFPRSMVRYSSWRRSLEIICMAQNCTYGIFDPWSYTEALWIINWVLINVSVHSPHICDIQVPEFLLNCCQASIRACTVILVRSRNRISGLWLWIMVELAGEGLWLWLWLLAFGTSTALQQHFNNTSTALQQQLNDKKKIL